MSALSYPEPSYDGLTEIWFDNGSDHDAFFSSKNYLEKVKPDESTFIDFASLGTVVVEEIIVIE